MLCHSGGWWKRVLSLVIIRRCDSSGNVVVAIALCVESKSKSRYCVRILVSGVVE